MDLCSYTEELFRKYFVNNIENVSNYAMESMDNNVILIGTGNHEFYENLEQFINSIDNEIEERNNVFLELMSFFCNEKIIDSKLSLVYGHFNIKGFDNTNKDSLIIDTNARFSILYQKQDNIWKIIHLHQSVPDYSQKDGEAYSKMSINELNITKQKIKELEKLATTDHLTNLLNYKGFFSKCDEILLSEEGNFYCIIIDVDNFKTVNDTYGHQKGDKVLKEFGKIFKGVIGSDGIAGRIGGDEFALFYKNIKSDSYIKDIINTIMEEVNIRKNNYRELFPGVSIGVSVLNPGENIKKAFKKADDMLYKVKKNGKNNFAGI